MASGPSPFTSTTVTTTVTTETDETEPVVTVKHTVQSPGVTTTTKDTVQRPTPTTTTKTTVQSPTATTTTKSTVQTPTATTTTKSTVLQPTVSVLTKTTNPPGGTVPPGGIAGGSTGRVHTPAGGLPTDQWWKITFGFEGKAAIGNSYCGCCPIPPPEAAPSAPKKEAIPPAKDQ